MQAIRSSNQDSSTRNGLALALAIVLTLLLAACGGGATDSTNPQVFINSANTSATASYQLSGGAFDNTGVTELVHTLNGGAEQALTLAGGQFSTTLTLVAGDNDITVTARDAAGNEGSTSITVDYQAAPSGETGHPDIAARGDVIQLNGSGFGASGSIDIGGVPAMADEWSSTQVTLTIPANAPGGPQTITVHGPYGSTGFDLFIGVDFGGDTIDELAALGLPGGTAVRLEAKTYTQVDPYVPLNLSLYGQGETETLIDASATSFWLAIGDHATLQGLTVESDLVFTSVAAPGPVDPLSVSAALSSPADIDLASLITVEALTAAHAASQGGELGTLATAARSLTLRDATITQSAGLLGFITFDITLGFDLPFAGDIHLERATLAFPDSLVFVFASGDVTIKESVVDAETFSVMSLGGDVNASDSGFSNGETPFPLGASGIFTQNNMSLTGNTFENSSQVLGFAPAWLLTGSFLPVGADYHIEGNEFISVDLDPLDAADNGNIGIYTPSGISLVHNNSFVVHRDVQLAAINGSLDLRGNDFELGAAGIAMSRLELTDMLPSHIEFSDNVVTWHNEGGLEIASSHQAVVTDNSFNGFNDSGIALTVIQGSSLEAGVQVLDNTFSDFEHALFVGGAGAGSEMLTLAVNHNVFDFAITAAGHVATLMNVEEADLNADFNQWGEEDDIPTLNGWIIEGGTTTPGILVINDILE